MRDRYGRHSQGQSTLLARRLVEAGVPFVSCFSHVDVDTRQLGHASESRCPRGEGTLPPADQAFAALLDDLHTRGLLDETLVIWMGEFGRTPRHGMQVSNNANNDGPRSLVQLLFSGAGGRRRTGGRVVGSSDASA